MSAGFFIAEKLSFKGRVAVVSTAISFLVIIISVAVSSGFRHEIRNALSDITGDVALMSPQADMFSGTECISDNPSYFDKILNIDGVKSITPVIYRAGIVKKGTDIQGVLFKGVPQNDSLSMQVQIPSRLASVLDLKCGDHMLAYFVGEKVKARRFTVAQVYDSLVEADSKLLVYVSSADLQRINGWDEHEVSALEIALSERFRTPDMLRLKASEIGSVATLSANDDDDALCAESSVSRYAQLFDWLSLIDANVLAVLLLMTLVAGFNMISGLLILLFRSISTIGLLKSMGMTDKGIAKVFLAVSAKAVALGMAIGNLMAFAFCLIQSSTHFLKLDPANYFVSFVPVHIEPLSVIVADLVCFVVVMAMLCLPCIFIARVDPAESVRMK